MKNYHVYSENGRLLPLARPPRKEKSATCSCGCTVVYDIATESRMASYTEHYWEPSELREYTGNESYWMGVK